MSVNTHAGRPLSKSTATVFKMLDRNPNITYSQARTRLAKLGFKLRSGTFNGKKYAWRQNHGLVASRPGDRNQRRKLHLLFEERQGNVDFKEARGLISNLSRKKFQHYLDTWRRHNRLGQSEPSTEEAIAFVMKRGGYEEARKEVEHKQALLEKFDGLSKQVRKAG